MSISFVLLLERKYTIAAWIQVDGVFAVSSQSASPWYGVFHQLQQEYAWLLYNEKCNPHFLTIMIDCESYGTGPLSFPVQQPRILFELESDDGGKHAYLPNVFSSPLPVHSSSFLACLGSFGYAWLIHPSFEQTRIKSKKQTILRQ